MVYVMRCGLKWSTSVQLCGPDAQETSSGGVGGVGGGGSRGGGGGGGGGGGQVELVVDRQTLWVVNRTTLEVAVNGGRKMCCESEGDFWQFAGKKKKVLPR